MRDVLEDLVGWWQAGETVGMGTVVATLSIDFHNEIRAGQLLLIQGAVTRVGTICRPEKSVPLPSWPRSLSPHAHRVPSRRMPASCPW